MPSYENEKCPVCERTFEQGDDIVTCPYCGTPHHRECYNKIGHCANKDKHAEGFDYQRDVAKADKPQEEHESESSRYFYNPNRKFDEENGGEQPAFPFAQPVPDFSDSERLDGVSLQDIAYVIRTKSLRFIEKFKKGAKLGWNWAALIFGPYYLFFRKMYKEGALTLAVRLIISLVAQGIYAKDYNAFASFFSSNAEALRNPTPELLEQATKYADKLMPMFAIMLLANLVLHIIIALFADNIYKKKVLSIVKRVDEKLENGSEFSQSMIIMGDQPRMTQEDMKRLYLSRLGGTSILSPVTAFLILDIVSSLISQIKF